MLTSMEVEADNLAEYLCKEVGSTISKLLKDELNSRLPPLHEIKKFTDELQILINAASYGKQRAWKNVFVVGVMAMKKDLTVKDVTETLRCGRTTGWAIFLVMI
jgi:hypothetical protein